MNAILRLLVDGPPSFLLKPMHEFMPSCYGIWQILRACTYMTLLQTMLMVVVQIRSTTLSWDPTVDQVSRHRNSSHLISTTYPICPSFSVSIYCSLSWTVAFPTWHPQPINWLPAIPAALRQHVDDPLRCPLPHLKCTSPGFSRLHSRNRFGSRSSDGVMHHSMLPLGNYRDPVGVFYYSVFQEKWEFENWVPSDYWYYFNDVQTLCIHIYVKCDISYLCKL